MEIQNVDNVIDSVNIVSRKSNKTGNNYKLLQIKLTNGFDIEFFPEKAEMYLLNHEAELAAKK
jgi:hypothetical protein